MLTNELEETLQTILGSKNPEIYHYQQGSHPGIKWYIKTIIPGFAIINDETFPLWSMWRFLSEHYSNLIKITNSSYDWQGNSIPHWWTIWLDQRVDIKVNWSKKSGFEWKFVDYDVGLKSSADEISNLLSTKFDNDRLTKLDIIHYKQLEYILNFLRTYTSDKRSKQNRKKLKVIENAEISDETFNDE